MRRLLGLAAAFVFATSAGCYAFPASSRPTTVPKPPVRVVAFRSRRVDGDRWKYKLTVTNTSSADEWVLFEGPRYDSTGRYLTGDFIRVSIGPHETVGVAGKLIVDAKVKYYDAEGRRIWTDARYPNSVKEFEAVFRRKL